LVHAGGALGMAGQRFGRRYRRARFTWAEDLAYRLDFLEIADRGRSRMRIDVIDRDLYPRESLAHAPRCALARRGDHVVAIGSCAVADDLAVNPGRSGF